MMNLSTPRSLTGRLMLPVFLSAALLGGCSSSSTDDVEETGSLYISLTDAEGDFNQYTVDVTSLKLYRSDGAVVETLPSTTRLDFTQYIDVSEFLTTATVPAGVYDKAEITLNYDQAEITVEDASGGSIPGSAVDTDGNPLGSLTLTAEINGDEEFVIRNGQIASLTMDFDLEASNSVSIDDGGTSATVVVEPVLIANTSIDDEKVRRARGLLDSVDVDSQSFVIDIRPFQVRHVSHGELTVLTTDETLYEIDGQSHVGAEGLQALSELGSGTPVVTLGRFDFVNREYHADEVFAGTSVPWFDMDGARGSVIARDGNRLTLLGATLETTDGSVTFQEEITVLVDDASTVYRQDSTDSFTIGDISVGQRLAVVGQLNDAGELDATGAAGGVLRMKYSDLAGSVVETGNGLVVDLQSINRRSILRYDFSGTGIDAASDADPDAYEVDTGSLLLDTVGAGEPVWIRGFPTAFGIAPPDFTARTVIDAGSLLTQMLVTWEPAGSTDAVASLDDSGLLLNPGTSGRLHYLKQAGIITDLSLLPNMPLIAPSDGQALYSISYGRRIRVFDNWSEFTTELQAQLDAGNPVLLVAADGDYDAGLAVLSCRKLIVRLGDLPIQ